MECRVSWRRFEWIQKSKEGGGIWLWFESVEKLFKGGGALLLGIGVSDWSVGLHRFDTRLWSSGRV